MYIKEYIYTWGKMRWQTKLVPVSEPIKSAQGRVKHGGLNSAGCFFHHSMKIVKFGFVQEVNY